MTSTSRTLSFRVRQPAALICRSASARYRWGGSIRWKLCLLRERSISGLLAYFSFLRSLWASMLVISGPLYLAKRMMAYCGWLNGGPPYHSANHVGDGHSEAPFVLMGDCFRLLKWYWTKCPAPTEPKSSGQNDHLIVRLRTEANAPPKPSYHFG